MIASACIHPEHQIEGQIDLSPILYGKDLRRQRGEFPSFYSVMDDHYFTLEEYFQTMESLVKDPKQGYKNLCKDYLNQNKELIC